MSSHEIDTIVLGVPCTIKFDYQPYEAADTGPEAQYPGCDEGFEITQVTVGEVDVTEWMTGGDMEDYFYDAIYEYREYKHEQYLEDRAERKWNSRFDDY
jgi:hypothetical protein